MARVASEWIANANNTVKTIGVNAYDSAAIYMGSLFELTTGSSLISNSVGPSSLLYSRIGEIASATSSYPHVVKETSRYYWIFTADTSATALTRKIHLTIHDRSLDALTYQGSIILNHFSVTGNKIMRSAKATLSFITNGTASVNGTAVTGVNTTFVNSNACVGNRIGFGSTDPAQITTWYEIGVIGSETSITLTGNAGVINSGPYVIEELRIAVSYTNATAANGGLFLVKGLKISNFIVAGTTISEVGTKLDNQRGIYWLQDASTVTNTIAAGLALEPQTSTGSQFAYIVNADATAKATIFKYNIRASLSGSFGAATPSGSTTAGYVLRTGQATLTASHVVSQADNGDVYLMRSGVASGSNSIFFTSNVASTSRVNRVPTVNVVSGSTSFVADSMLENPPGGTSTIAVVNAMMNAKYADFNDKIIIPNTATPGRTYLTSYKTDLSQMDCIYNLANNIVFGSAGDATATVFPDTRAAGLATWCIDGFAYAINTSTTAAGNILFAYPIGADWLTSDSAGQYFISPKIATPNASKLYKLLVSSFDYLGSNTTFTAPREPMNIYVRTSGIDDNSGSWTLIDSTGDISGIGAGSYIQVKIAFKVAGLTCIPNKINSIQVIYENDSQDSHYQPSLTFSSTANRQFAWKQVVVWGSAIPTMRIRLFDADLGTTLLDDNSASGSYGVWQYSSTSGSSWSTWSTGADSVGNYIRYTANSLSNNVTVRVLLTQL